MQIGILCPEIHGHLNPMLAVASELRRRGHRLTLIGIRDGEQATRAAGIDFHPIGEDVFPAGGHVAYRARLAALSGLAAVRFTIAMYVQQAQVLLEEAPAAIESLGAEGLLIDQTVVAGRTIAERVGLPFVNLCGALPLNRELGIPPVVTGWVYRDSLLGVGRNLLGYHALEFLARSMTKLISQWRTQFGLPAYPIFTESFSKLAEIGQLTKEFDFPRRRLSPCFHYAGPLHDAATRSSVPFPTEQLPEDRPLVYASLGTLQNGQEMLFHRIAEACSRLPVQLVISFGGGVVPSGAASYPGNPIVVEFAPQLELVRRAKIVITHAGMNTTIETLAQGTPMIAIPIANDQPAVAARIAWTGCGTVIPPRRLTARRLRHAVDELLNNDKYERAAHCQQQAIRAAGGIPRAADVILLALREGLPVTASGA